MALPMVTMFRSSGWMAGGRNWCWNPSLSMMSPTTAVKSSRRACAKRSAWSIQRSVIGLSFRIACHFAGRQQVGARAPRFGAHRLGAIVIGSFRVGTGGHAGHLAVFDVPEVDGAPGLQRPGSVSGRQYPQAHEFEHAIGEHRRRRALRVAFGIVEDGVPEPVGILRGLETFGQFPCDGSQFLVL